MVVSRTLFNISKDFVGTDDLPEFQLSIGIARFDVVSVGPELSSNNYGKSPLIISSKKCLQRAPLLKWAGRRKKPHAHRPKGAD